VQGPWYGLVLAAATFVVVVFGAYPRQLVSHWSAPWLCGIGVIALVLGLVFARRNAQRAAELGPPVTGLSVRDCREVSKALTSGPVPANPAIRQAALLLGQRALPPATRSARLVVVVSVLNVLLQVVGFVLEPRHYTLGALLALIVFSTATGYYLNFAHLLGARVQLLRDYSQAPADLP